VPQGHFALNSAAEIFFPLLFIIATAYRMIDEIAGLEGQKSLGKLSVASQARELLAR